MRRSDLVFWMHVLSLAFPTLGWQDDVLLVLKEQATLFSQKPGFSYLSGAQAEIRLGRYFLADKNFGWRGGLEGDVALLNFGESLLWHMGLNMETLADDQNDINFRLVQVYYQALTGIKWRLPAGVIKMGYRHRCSHGADNAEHSRITIRSGLTAAFQWSWQSPKLRLDIEPGTNIYFLGQNKDLTTQPLGNLYLSLQGIWPLYEPLSLVIGMGTQLEVVGRSQSFFYVISDLANFRLEPLFGTRVAARIQKNRLQGDFAFHVAQNLDSGIKAQALKTTNLSFDVDFFW